MTGGLAVTLDISLAGCRGSVYFGAEGWRCRPAYATFSRGMSMWAVTANRWALVVLCVTGGGGACGDVV